MVSSGAVAAGVAALGLSAAARRSPHAAGARRARPAPPDGDAGAASLAEHGAVAAQVLLVPHDFVNRRQYLHARQTLVRLLELGCVPVVNENDAIADDEIRFGDNDRLAALVAHLVSADVLVLLTDLAGLYTADPRRDAVGRAHRPGRRRRPHPGRRRRRDRLGSAGAAAWRRS